MNRSHSRSRFHRKYFLRYIFSLVVALRPSFANMQWYRPLDALCTRIDEFFEQRLLFIVAKKELYASNVASQWINIGPMNRGCSSSLSLWTTYNFL